MISWKKEQMKGESILIQESTNKSREIFQNYVHPIFGSLQKVKIKSDWCCSSELTD